MRETLERERRERERRGRHAEPAACGIKALLGSIKALLRRYSVKRDTENPPPAVY
jgi:hypothetical protein